ncbi:oligopeptide:H+ symporter [Paenibacillus sp. FSL R10-2734]|uniref:oligopeptide:H+ symporter n=1 Tax=Paenibacillus sp. FSL R10-2734 TaxID=2954691 RepID=UPI0030DB3ABE
MDRVESKDMSLDTIRSDKGFFGHPKGIGALAVGNFFNSAAWGAFYAIMIFYLYTPYTKGLGFSEGNAAQMITAMAACNSLFVILGSWLADRVLGMRKALIIGNIVKGSAFLLLAIPVASLGQGRIFAIVALFLLSLPIMGASNASLTGQLYRKTDNGRRDAAFTIHQFMNTVAGVITPVIVGQIGMSNYHIGFGIAAFFAFMYGAVIFFTQHKFFGTLGAKPVSPLEKGQFKKIFSIFLAILVVILGIIAILIVAKVIALKGVLNIITSATFIIPIIFLTSLFRKKDLTDADRRHMKPFMKLFSAQVVMALCGTMLTSAIAIFIDRKVERNMFGFEIAPGSIPTIYTVLGLIAGPIFVYLYTKTKAKDVKIVNKYAIGVLLSGLGFAVLAIPIMLLHGSGPYSLLWLVFYYLFLALSDQFIWPIGSSMVSKLSPEAYETQMQTAWGQTAAIANGIALILFNFFQTADQQVYLFPILAGVLVVTAALLFANSKKIDEEMM